MVPAEKSAITSPGLPAAQGKRGILTTADMLPYFGNYMVTDWPVARVEVESINEFGKY